jgi:hypothetical protein
VVDLRTANFGSLHSDSPGIVVPEAEEVLGIDIACLSLASRSGWTAKHDGIQRVDDNSRRPAQSKALAVIFPYVTASYRAPEFG